MECVCGAAVTLGFLCAALQRSVIHVYLLASHCDSGCSSGVYRRYRHWKGGGMAVSARRKWNGMAVPWAEPMRVVPVRCRLGAGLSGWDPAVTHGDGETRYLSNVKDR